MNFQDAESLSFADFKRSFLGNNTVTRQTRIGRSYTSITDLTKINDNLLDPTYNWSFDMSEASLLRFAGVFEDIIRASPPDPFSPIIWKQLITYETLAHMLKQANTLRVSVLALCPDMLIVLKVLLIHKYIDRPGCTYGLNICADTPPDGSSVVQDVFMMIDKFVVAQRSPSHEGHDSTADPALNLGLYIMEKRLMTVEEIKALLELVKAKTDALMANEHKFSQTAPASLYAMMQAEGIASRRTTASICLQALHAINEIKFRASVGTRSETLETVYGDTHTTRLVRAIYFGFCLNFDGLMKRCLATKAPEAGPHPQLLYFNESNKRADVELLSMLVPVEDCFSASISYLADRELHELHEKMPDSQVFGLIADLKRNLSTFHTQTYSPNPRTKNRLQEVGKKYLEAIEQVLSSAERLQSHEDFKKPETQILFKNCIAQQGIPNSYCYMMRIILLFSSDAHNIKRLFKVLKGLVSGCKRGTEIVMMNTNFKFECLAINHLLEFSLFQYFQLLMDLIDQCDCLDLLYKDQFIQKILTLLLERMTGLTTVFMRNPADEVQADGGRQPLLQQLMVNEFVVSNVNSYRQIRLIVAALKFLEFIVRKREAAGRCCDDLELTLTDLLTNVMPFVARTIRNKANYTHSERFSILQILDRQMFDVRLPSDRILPDLMTNEVFKKKIVVELSLQILITLQVTSKRCMSIEHSSAVMRNLMEPEEEIVALLDRLNKPNFPIVMKRALLGVLLSSSQMQNDKTFGVHFMQDPKNPQVLMFLRMPSFPPSIVDIVLRDSENLLASEIFPKFKFHYFSQCIFLAFLKYAVQVLADRPSMLEAEDPKRIISNLTGFIGIARKAVKYFLEKEFERFAQKSNVNISSQNPLISEAKKQALDLLTLISSFLQEMDPVIFKSEYLPILVDFQATIGPDTFKLLCPSLNLDKHAATGTKKSSEKYVEQYLQQKKKHLTGLTGSEVLALNRYLFSFFSQTPFFNKNTRTERLKGTCSFYQTDPYNRKLFQIADLLVRSSSDRPEPDYCSLLKQTPDDIPGVHPHTIIQYSNYFSQYIILGLGEAAFCHLTKSKKRRASLEIIDQVMTYYEATLPSLLDTIRRSLPLFEGGKLDELIMRKLVEKMLEFRQIFKSNFETHHSIFLRFLKLSIIAAENLTSTETVDLFTADAFIPHLFDNLTRLPLPEFVDSDAKDCSIHVWKLLIAICENPACSAQVRARVVNPQNSNQLETFIEAMVRKAYRAVDPVDSSPSLEKVASLSLSNQSLDSSEPLIFADLAYRLSQVNGLEIASYMRSRWGQLRAENNKTHFFKLAPHIDIGKIAAEAQVKLDAAPLADEQSRAKILAYFQANESLQLPRTSRAEHSFSGTFLVLVIAAGLAASHVVHSSLVYLSILLCFFLSAVYPKLRQRASSQRSVAAKPLADFIQFVAYLKKNDSSAFREMASSTNCSARAEEPVLELGKKVYYDASAAAQQSPQGTYYSISQTDVFEIPATRQIKRPLFFDDDASADGPPRLRAPKN